MDTLPPIRTPWKQQWKRIRYQLVPVVVMGFCMLLTGYLWHRHSAILSGLGEVEANQFTFASDRDGRLVPLPAGKLKLYDEVEPGDEIARFDDVPAKATLAVLKSELTRMERELEFRKKHPGEVENEQRVQQKEVDALRLAVLDRAGQLDTDKVELKRLNEVQDALKAGNASGLNSPRELVELQAKRDVLAQRIRGGEAALAQAQAQLKAAEEQLTLQQNLAAASAEEQVALLAGAIETQKARLAETEMQIQSLVVRSPIRGKVVAIHQKPGQVVRFGEPIVSIASQEAQHITYYIRQDQRIQAEENMPVEIRSRLAGSKPVKSLVKRVGPQLEAVPAHQLRDPRVQEWGVPVLIALPPGMNVRPGELVTLQFQANNNPN